MTEMWKKLNAYTLSAVDASERPINSRNEWGGFSRRLGMPVFTGWQDFIHSAGGRMKVLICDRAWPNLAGVRNQQRWIEHGGEAGFFLIKAVDPDTIARRKVEWLDDSRVICGQIVCEGDQSFIVSTHQVQL